MRTSSSAEKKRFASQGLARLTEDDGEMEALLLRQLYLGLVEEGSYAEAFRVADEIVELGELGDIARQDAARAAIGLGEIDVAIGHLRIAARVCPPDRRAFHMATLGALLRFDGRNEEAVDAFSRANRWAVSDRALYQAQLALAEELVTGKPAPNLRQLRQLLENDENQKGYALWVLGELCTRLGDREAGRLYLTQFLHRLEDAPRAKSLALQGEIAAARALLSELTA